MPSPLVCSRPTAAIRAVQLLVFLLMVISRFTESHLLSSYHAFPRRLPTVILGTFAFTGTDCIAGGRHQPVCFFMLLGDIGQALKMLRRAFGTGL